MRTWLVKLVDRHEVAERTLAFRFEKPLGLPSRRASSSPSRSSIRPKRFVKSWEDLLACIAERSALLKKTG
jgi:hypothetical protein